MNAMSVWCTWFDSDAAPKTTLLFIGCGTVSAHLHIHDVSLFTLTVEEGLP